MVTPGTVDQKEFPEVAELANGDISTACCLETFHSANANTNMGSLDHGNIIGTVADGKKNSFQVTLDQLDDKCLLQRRYSARDS